jgi:transcriptional regulator with XRE-family HTH domain
MYNLLYFYLVFLKKVHYILPMKTLAELGEAVAVRRKALKLRQGEVAARAGLTRGYLVGFERGQATEFGSRKLLAVLAVLGLEISFTEVGKSGTLDELRRERGGTA